MKLLMHICCANCSLYPITHLRAKNIDIKGFWFNPNIHPSEEYKKRLDALNTLGGIWNLDIEYVDRYGLTEYLKATDGNTENGKRCSVCYMMRLRETARAAKKMALDGFTTTLLVSPYQKFDMIVDIGRLLEKEYSIGFYLEDMRQGFKEGMRLSKELGLYRQRYCGCIYSEMEKGAQPPRGWLLGKR